MSNTCKIGSIAKVRRGASPRPIGDPKYFGGKVGWIRISDVTASRKYLRKTEQYVSLLGESLSVRVNKGDLIMSICGTIGRPIIIDFPSCIHDGFVQLYDIKNADKEYLYYVLQYHEKDFEGKGQPGTQVNLNTGIVENFEIYYPSLPNQLQIARILSTCDEVIEKTQAAIAKYKAIKQGMLHDLFTRGIDIKTGKLRPKYEDAPELYKESKLGWVPRDWEVCKLGKYIVNNLYGPRFSAQDYSENGNVRTIRGTDFSKDGEILYSQAPKALLPTILVSTHKLEKGDVVIVTTADCGLTAIFNKPKNEVDFIPSAYCVKYRFAKNVNPYFIKYFMATDFAIKLVNKFVRQGTLGNLPGSDVLKFDMAYPKTEEQNKIAKRLKSIDTKLQTEQIYLLKMQSIKQGLMGDLLSGRKSVIADAAVNKDINDDGNSEKM
jgi:type I restriction enzyme, S subunit